MSHSKDDVPKNGTESSAILSLRGAVRQKLNYFKGLSNIIKTIDDSIEDLNVTEVTTTMEGMYQEVVYEKMRFFSDVTNVQRAIEVKNIELSVIAKIKQAESRCKRLLMLVEKLLAYIGKTTSKIKKANNINGKSYMGTVTLIDRTNELSLKIDILLNDITAVFERLIGVLHADNI